MDDNDEVSIHYKWLMHEFLEDGTLFMRTSVYGPGYHSSGKFSVPPDSPDFAFWVWLINVKKPVRRIGEKEHAEVHGSELEALCQEHRDCSTGAV